MYIGGFFLKKVNIMENSQNINTYNNTDFFTPHFNQNYTTVPFQIINTQHIITKVIINAKYSSFFIIDTGASATCLDLAFAKKIKQTSVILLPNEKAMGIGTTNMQKSEVYLQTLKLENNYLIDNYKCAVINLRQVRKALTLHGFEHTIGGIIGADILISRHAIIDYANNVLHLKKN